LFEALDKNMYFFFINSTWKLIALNIFTATMYNS